MPEPIYPAGEWVPGRASAGYTRGRTTMVSIVAHYTVGRDSSGPAYLGNLFQFLATRDGRILQGAEADSVCWHAGHPYNQRGPGIEVEYLPGSDDTVFTDAQRDATGKLCRWLESEWGIPLAYHDDPNDKRSDWHGTISHRSVVSDADVHSDYWPREDWDAMFAVPAPPPAPTFPAFALTGESAMSFASAVTPSAGVYETFRINASGVVEQWYYPRASDGEHADVATGGKPGGDVQIVRQTAASGKVGRGDVWFEKPDGTLGHAFQAGDGDWVWNVDTLGW